MDHTEGPEAAAAGKKRMEERYAGRQGKRCMHEESGGSPANTQGMVVTVPASRPSAVNKPRKAPALCEHHRVRSKCKDCGGSGLCEHQRERSKCKDYGGGSFCEHQRRRSRCKEFGWYSFCCHQRPRSLCQECGGGDLCQHQRPHSKCRDCGGGSFCQYQRSRSLCLECGGSSLCRHQKPKWSCRACNRCKVPHHEARGRWRKHCWECGKEDPAVCDHNRCIMNCPQCKRGGLTFSTGRGGSKRHSRLRH